MKPRQAPFERYSVVTNHEPPAPQGEVGSYADSYIRSFSVSKALQGHSGCVNSVEFSIDGSLLITGSDDRHVCIYSTDEGPGGFASKGKIQLRHDANIFHAMFLPSNPAVVISCALDGKTILTDVSEPDHPVASIIYRAGMVLASKIACHPSWNHTAFVGYGDGNVVWADTRENGSIVAKWNPHRAYVEEINSLAVHPSHPFTMCVGTNTHLTYLVDVRRIPTSDSTSAVGTIRIPSVKAGSTEGIGGLCFSSSGAQLCVNFKSNDVFVVPWLRYLQSDNSQQLTARQSSEEDIVRCRGRKNERTMFKEATFFNNDEYVVSGGDCGFLHFWRAKDGSRLHRTRGDGDIVNGVLTHDARPFLVCSGIDSTAKVISSCGDFAIPAESAEKALFGSHRLTQGLFANSDDDPSDEEEEDDDDAEDSEADEYVSVGEDSRLQIWTLSAEDDGDPLLFHTKLEQLRILCLAFSRHFQQMLGTGDDVPIFALKRMVAIVIAVRHMGDESGQASRNLVLDSDEGESSADSDNESMDTELLRSDDPSTDAEDSPDDESVRDDSSSSIEAIEENEEQNPMLSMTSGIISVSLSLAQQLVHSLDALFRAATDESGVPYLSLHWYNARFGSLNGIETPPLAVCRAKLLLLILEGLIVDKGPVMTSATDSEKNQWKKLVCATLLRRLYLEMGFGNTERCLQLIEHLSSHPRYDGLAGLGPYPSRRLGRTAQQGTTRVVALALQLRVLKLSGSMSDDVGQVITQSISSQLRAVVSSCKQSNNIIRRLNLMMESL